MTLTQLLDRSAALLELQNHARATGDHDTADRIMRERDTLDAEYTRRLKTALKTTTM